MCDGIGARELPSQTSRGVWLEARRARRETVSATVGARNSGVLNESLLFSRWPEMTMMIMKLVDDSFDKLFMDA